MHLVRQLLNILLALTFAGTFNPVRTETSGGSRRFSKNQVLLSTTHNQNTSPGDKKGYLSGYYDTSLCLSPRGIAGMHMLLVLKFYCSSLLKF